MAFILSAPFSSHMIELVSLLYSTYLGFGGDLNYTLLYYRRTYSSLEVVSEYKKYKVPKILN